jgi:uncharacterized membrane protein
MTSPTHVTVEMLNQIVSVVGAVLILVAYFALQTNRLQQRDRRFSAMNFVGSVLLTWVAVVDRQVGFILLEGTWALLSIPGMVRRKP